MYRKVSFGIISEVDLRLKNLGKELKSGKEEEDLVIKSFTADI